MLRSTSPLFHVGFIAEFFAGFAVGEISEPLEIGTTPQFFVDDALVDNRWALKQKKEAVLRVLHPPVKYAGNPVLHGDAGYVSVDRDSRTGMFRMWYQTREASAKGEENDMGAAIIAYAESKDGLQWSRPNLGIYEIAGSRENNITWKGLANSRASGLQILQLPEKDRRGYRYILAYRTTGAKRGNNGIRLVGSQDGIHWDTSSDTLIHTVPSDTLNSIVHDPERGQYVLYCRPKLTYRVGKGDLVDTGESRRIARVASPELWARWEQRPETILIPDELDARENFNAFYGMPTRYHGGIFWGALWCFRFNDHVRTELAYSRDGYRFSRLPDRPRLLDLGAEGTWDDSMVFASPDWVEIGDEWWFYYAGWDGPHGNSNRTAGVGLAKARKEGLVSLRGPRGGGVVVTRLLRWPGGELVINADARHGEVTVRVSDEGRKVLPGFDYADGEPFTGDSTSHPVKWREASLAKLKGELIRLEFQLRDADLYTFRAASE